MNIIIEGLLRFKDTKSFGYLDILVTLFLIKLYYFLVLFKNSVPI